MSAMSIEVFADKVMDVMQAIFREYTKQQMGDFYKMKITMPQFVILDLLERQGESKMTEMARFIGVTTAGMTGIVDKLVKYGYCIRKSDPSDRRVVKIRPTEKGARLVKTISLHRREMTVDMFSKISQEERVEYLKILEHIKEHLK